MDRPTTECCPFCKKQFKKLGNHYKGCPERNGRDYNHLLSQKTLAKKCVTQKTTCPKCGKKCTRIDTHLRNNASCKNTMESQLPTRTEPTSTAHEDQPADISTLIEPQGQPTPTNSITQLPRLKLPQSPDEWAEADLYMHTSVVPLVLMQSDVEAMNNSLCNGIYAYFSSRHGTVTSSNQHNQHLPQVRNQTKSLKKLQIEKNEAKKKLRCLKRSGNSPQEVQILARKFHQLVRAHSALSKKVKKSDKKKNQNQQRKACHRDLQKFIKATLDDNNYSSIQPDFSKQEAESYFKTTYASAPRSFSCPRWLPKPSPPTAPMSTCEFTAEEIQHVIDKVKSSSIPCPIDQIPYTK